MIGGRDWGLGWGIGDWDGVGIGDFELGLGIRIGIWDWGLGLGIAIGDWEFGIGD